MTLHGKRKFADVVKLGLWRWENDPGLSRWVQCHHNSLCKREAGGSVGEKEIGDKSRDREKEIESCSAAGFEDGGWGHEPQHAGGLYKMKRHGHAP